MFPENLTPAAASHLAAMIPRAERRRAMIERLAEICITVTEDMAIRMIDSPHHPEPRHDPGRSLAAVARSVRLTVALETTIDKEILALCNGDIAAIVGSSKAAPTSGWRGSVPPEPGAPSVRAGPDIAAERSSEAADQEVGEAGEHLFDVERPDVFQPRFFRPNIEDIGPDLVLHHPLDVGSNVNLDGIAWRVAPPDRDYDPPPPVNRSGPGGDDPPLGCGSAIDPLHRAAPAAVRPP